MNEKRLWFKLDKIATLEAFLGGNKAKSDAAEAMMTFLEKPSAEEYRQMDEERHDDIKQRADLLAALEYGAGAQDGPTFLEFVAWQLEEREILDATAEALRLKAAKERAALAGARGGG